MRGNSHVRFLEGLGGRKAPRPTRLQQTEGTLMPERPIDPTRHDEDWYGNNVAVTCPVCGKVYIGSSFLDGGIRRCPEPQCGRSMVRVATQAQGGGAIIEWED
jgi:hypothetical protein